MSKFDLKSEIEAMRMAEQQNCIGGNCILVDAIGFKRSHTYPGERPPKSLLFPIKIIRSFHAASMFAGRPYDFPVYGDTRSVETYKTREFRLISSDASGRAIYEEVIHDR